MMNSRLSEAQVITELALLEKLRTLGLTFDRRRVNSEREPHYVEGFVHDVHVWIYEDGGASVVGRGADLMIEKEDYRTPEALRTAIVNAVVGLVSE